jgi:hypothetical protein
VSFGPIGKESSKGLYKQYGYGAPVKITFRVGDSLRSAVLETMSPGPFGHEHMADRAQAMLWDYHSYGRLPRHVKALDVGAFTARGTLFSIAEAEELFVLTQWEEGTSYHVDLERLANEETLPPLDRRRTEALARYLAVIHRKKRRDPDLYRRRLRELIGHGECIMGLTDSYPERYEFITEDLLRRVEEACNRWRWRLRERTDRLSQVHGDFHPWNVLFRQGTDFSVLDRSRGEWGERFLVRQSFQIHVIARALFPLGQHEQLLRLGDGEERPPRRKGADIESFHMTGEPSIRVIIPQHRLRPVGHVLMTKRAWTHRFEHGGLELGAYSKSDLDRCPVAVLFIQSFRTFFTDRTERHDAGT